MRIFVTLIFLFLQACEKPTEKPHDEIVSVVTTNERQEPLEYKQEPEINLEEQDCSGLLGNFEVYGLKRGSVKLNGKWALGELLDNGKFIPLLYFRTNKDAVDCVGKSATIRKFDGKTNQWVKK